DETNLPPEAGIAARAISYRKGCYIGQEVIARLRTYGQVTKTLRGLHPPAAWTTPPARGDKLFADGKEVGQVTSAIATFAMGYVRKEHHAPGTQMLLRTAAGECPVTVVELASGS
ncbi:MAG: glycine cleavage T C-terminal barrel domain-containing protein, partial [Limisphaerales bacterium]